ncbi:MAG TPA: VWA domain-containing protein [Pyrinomonadaceae bacterium]|jgi:Ca-activated chloride channel family protein
MSALNRIAVRAALCAFLYGCLIALNGHASLAQQTQTATQATPSRPDGDDSIILTVTVTNKKGAYVGGLSKSNFILYEDKAPHETTFFTNRDEPLSVGLVFDASASMAVPGSNLANPATMLKPLIKGVARFLSLSNGSNEYFLIGFNTQPQLLVDWTRNPRTILDTLSTVRSKGNTALFDACYLSAAKTMNGQHRKRVLILITDGLDNVSKYKFSELRKLVRQSDLLIYTLKIPNDFNPGIALQEDTRDKLDELAKDSGGRVFSPQNEMELAEAFETLATELRHQYTIGFKPSIPPGNKKWRPLKVSLTLPANAPFEMQQLRVRNRAGYYAAENPR